MGTPSTTVVYDEDGEAICALYGSSDGYLSEHGKKLAQYLSGFGIGDGIGLSTAQVKKYANGMDCLAAQIVAHFKTGPGYFYLVPPHYEVDGHVYSVKLGPGRTKVNIEYVFENEALEFSGTPEEFQTYIGLVT